MKRDYHFRYAEMMTSEATEHRHHQPMTEESNTKPDMYPSDQAIPPYRDGHYRTFQDRNNLGGQQQVQVIQLGGSNRKRYKQPSSSGSPPVASDASRIPPEHYFDQPIVETFKEQIQQPVAATRAQPLVASQQSTQPQSKVPTPAQRKHQVMTWQERILSKCIKNIQRLRKAVMVGCFKKLQEHSSRANKMILLFTNHCATMIQKHFRRYIMQKYYRHYKRCLARMKQLVQAVSIGWKVRRVMKTRTILRMVEDIRKKQQDRKLRDMRIQKRELASEIAKMMKNAKWLEEYRAARATAPKPNKFRFLRGTTRSTDENEQTAYDGTVTIKAPSPLKQKSSMNDDLPLPTHINSNKPPLVNHEDLPIKATGAAQYNFEEELITDQPVNTDLPEKPKKPVLKKAPLKKKVIKLAASQDDKPSQPKQSDSLEKVPEKKLYLPANLPQAKIVGDIDPLDMSEKQWLEAPAPQKNSSESEEEDERKRYLKRRTKYDPRKAIEEEKKRKLLAPNIAAVPIVAAPQIPDPPVAKSRSRSTDKTTQQQPRKQIVQPRKGVTPDPQPKDLSATLKRLPPPPKIDPKPTTSFTHVRSPTNLPPKQKHIPLQELQTTYEAAYLSKKHTLLTVCEKLGRKSRKISYPIPSVRQISDVYRRFAVASFEVLLQSMQGTETLLQQQYRCMLNM